jgi:glycosyltransferase involved in cell wall biosynthesis
MPTNIIMPAHNEQRYIAVAIESVLAQSYTDFELIILDDGSVDSTREIALSYAAIDARVRVESHPNMGIAATLNKGIALAASEWIVQMHADDVMMPNRLERQLAFVREHPELAVASSWVKHINSEGKVIAKGNTSLTTHQDVQMLYLSNQLVGISHPAAILRKSAVQAVGGYRDQFRVNEDVDLWNRMLEQGYKILVQPEYLLQYRVHEGSASIAQARLIGKQIHWVKDCMLRRRRGEPELTWTEFVSDQKKRSWYVRINGDRKDMAKVLYKSAALHFAQSRYLAAIAETLGAIVLQPGYSIPQVSSKLLVHRS